MTYQATASTMDLKSSGLGIGAGLRAFFSSLGHAFVVNSSAHRRFEKVQALQAKTDAELAAMNLQRDDIVHYVFRDLYYT